MRLLAFDTASDSCSAAVWADGGVVARDRVAMARGHAEALMPMILRVLEQAAAGFSDLDGLAVTVGPGSFTGLRTGLAAARGLALACGRPLMGVTTLETVAYSARATKPDSELPGGCLVALDTRRADLYVQLFPSRDGVRAAPAALSPEAAVALLPVGPVLLAGNGIARMAEPLARRLAETGTVDPVAPGDGCPDAVDVAALAARRWAAQGPESDRPPAPLYVHPPQASIPPREGRLRP